MPREVISLGTMFTIIGAILASTLYITKRFDDVLERIAAADKDIGIQAATIAEIARQSGAHDSRLNIAERNLALLSVRQSWLYGKVLGKDVDLHWPQTEHAQ